jgi:hypothetical protein
MKKEHEDKMADLCNREEEAKKQVKNFFLNLLFYFSNKRWKLGNKCIENGWQLWNEELIIYKSPMKIFKYVFHLKKQKKEIVKINL